MFPEAMGVEVEGGVLVRECVVVQALGPDGSAEVLL